MDLTDGHKGAGFPGWGHSTPDGTLTGSGDAQPLGAPRPSRRASHAVTVSPSAPSRCLSGLSADQAGAAEGP